jgi:hypothetical protein
MDLFFCELIIPIEVIKLFIKYLLIAELLEAPMGASLGDESTNRVFIRLP